MYTRQLTDIEKRVVTKGDFVVNSTQIFKNHKRGNIYKYNLFDT